MIKLLINRPITAKYLLLVGGNLIVVVPLLPLLLVDLLDGPELLLELHPPVLEPDLDLALGQAERVGDLYAPPPGEIMVKMELLLQLQGLEPSIGLSTSPPGTSVGTFNNCTLQSVFRKDAGKIKPHNSALRDSRELIKKLVCTLECRSNLSCDQKKQKNKLKFIEIKIKHGNLNIYIFFLPPHGKP